MLNFINEAHSVPNLNIQSPIFFMKIKSILKKSLFQAGLRTLHEAGPEVKRAISGNLEELTDVELETNTRRNMPFFGNVIQSIKRKGSIRNLTVNNVQHAKVSPTNSYSYHAHQNSFNKLSDK